MQELNFASVGRSRPLHFLCLGAHCDDIEIGCGGALLELLARYKRSRVTWVTFSGSSVRLAEHTRSAKQFLRQAGAMRLINFQFRDGFFPASFDKVKEAFEALKQLPEPDVIFSHQLVEAHQDHRIVADLTWNTFRRHLILQYEIPKYEGGLTTPSVYVPIRQSYVNRKIRILLSCYKTQAGKSWFSEESFRGLMRLRGIESGGDTGWAEGFHGSKLLLV